MTDTGRRAFRTARLLGAVLALGVGSCTAATGHSDFESPQASAATRQVSAVCGNTVPGPRQPPERSVPVKPGKADNLATKTDANPPGTTFWLAAGTHTLDKTEFAQVAPKNGNTYLGAPGAVLDGQGVNRYAFAQRASDVTIAHLTVQNFAAPHNEGVVNHDSGNGWLIEHNTIQHNDGAALMAGSDQVVRANCLRHNGQYAMNAYQTGNQLSDLVVVGNEIVKNNTDDWESKVPGCGCTGGMKFWSVDGATIRDNWIHDNYGAGLWADTNNNDFLIEGNVFEGNDAEAIIYETSYNAIIRDNVLIKNALVKGREFADSEDDFPVPAIYISESGGEPRIAARTDRIEIHGNVLKSNWSGITLWENSDRYCNSPANPTEDCTLLVDDRQQCSQPTISSPPDYHNCRWQTQRVEIHDNRFVSRPDIIECKSTYCGRMALLANYGSYPDWSPYKGTVIQESITFHQHNNWHDNTYIGAWSFIAHDRGNTLSWKEWRAAPYDQDQGSTLQK